MKLTKVSKLFWVYFAFIIVITGVLIFLLLTYKIDDNVKIQLVVSEEKRMHIVAQQNVFYKIKAGQNIKLNINEKNYFINIYKVKIEGDKCIILFDNNSHELASQLKKGLILDGNLIYKQTTLLKKIMG